MNFFIQFRNFCVLLLFHIWSKYYDSKHSSQKQMTATQIHVKKKVTFIPNSPTNWHNIRKFPHEIRMVIEWRSALKKRRIFNDCIMDFFLFQPISTAIALWVMNRAINYDYASVLFNFHLFPMTIQTIARFVYEFRCCGPIRFNINLNFP